MGFITNAISSALTPRGTNARESQVNQQKKASQGASSALDWLNPLIGQQAEFASGLEPSREADLKRMLYLSSPGNDAARQDIYARQAASNAQLAARSASAASQGAGLSDAYTAGNNVATANSAAQSANQNWQQMNSPEYQLKQAQALIQQYQQAMGLPSQSAYDNAASVIYGRPAVPVQPGFGQVLGGLAGQYAADQTGGA